MPFDGTGVMIQTDLLAKVDLIMEMLGAEERWCKKQFRGQGGDRCLLGALKDANGGKDLSAMILRAAVETSGICYDRIDHFNDSPSTDHALVMRVLGRVRHAVANGCPLLPPGQPILMGAVERRMSSRIGQVSRKPLWPVAMDGSGKGRYGCQTERRGGRVGRGAGSVSICMSPADPDRSFVAAAQPAEAGRKLNGRFGAIDRGK